MHIFILNFFQFKALVLILFDHTSYSPISIKYATKNQKRKPMMQQIYILDLNLILSVDILYHSLLSQDITNDWFGQVSLFNGILTFTDYLLPNPLL